MKIMRFLFGYMHFLIATIEIIYISVSFCLD